MHQFIDDLENLISKRKKITSPLYQVIMEGKASLELVQNFVIHRFPIKNLWTRNILGIASKIEDYPLRCELVENIYEEETGALTNSSRHLQTFLDFGEVINVKKDRILKTPLLPETEAVMQHNLQACNSDVHFTSGVASVLLLMEGQPPILSTKGLSMEMVMRDTYGLPQHGYEFFTHHASAQEGSISELEEKHASTAKHLLIKYCTTEALRNQAISALKKAINLRHQHFDAIYNNFYVRDASPFRYTQVHNIEKNNDPISNVG